jgi:hypothetical protein
MASCETFHYTPSRLGSGEGAPRILRWHKRLEIDLNAATRGAPLIYSQRVIAAQGVHFKTYVYIASSDNTVRAYDENALLAGHTIGGWGQVVPIWAAQLGSPASGEGTNIGGDVGVTSTPVLDPDRNRLLVCSCHHKKIRHGAGIQYFIYAIDMFDGKVLQSVELVDVGSPERNFRFEASAEDQRGALNLVNGVVYATFAAFRGDDLGNYHGWLVGCDADDLNIQNFLPTTRTVLGGGCWGPGGAAGAPDGSVFIATGNATFPTFSRHAYFVGRDGRPPAEIGDYFLSVLRVKRIQHKGGVPPQPLGAPKLEVVDWFQPAKINRPADPIRFGGHSGPVTLEELDEKDLDFGSSSCMVLPVINGWRLLVVSTKAFVFLLNAENLGQMGGALDTKHVYVGYDASKPAPVPDFAESHCAPSYLFADGEHLVFLSGGGVWSDGGVSSLVCFKVDATTPQPSLALKWRANVPLTTACASPTVSVSTTGIAGQPDFHALVWVADISANDFRAGRPFLQAYDALTGRLVFDSLANPADQLQSDLPHYAPITCAGHSVYLGTSAGFALFRADADFIRRENA